MSVTPTVAIVGRPNVGKSTLFNRLVGRRQAIVHDKPGVTRDRITGLAEIGPERSAMIIDTGGLLVGGKVPGDEASGLNEQVFAAVEESDVVVVVVDGKHGLVAADETVAETIRRHGKPTVLAVNKGDTRVAGDQFHEFHRLGLSPQLLLSAEHGVGVGELRDALLELLPAGDEPPAGELPRLAIVGRPNVGKSALLNRILGRRRAVVAETPGTTRDPIDSVIETDDGSYLLVDTAGIRRRSRVSDTPEELAVMMARRQIEQAQLAILVIEAPRGVTSGDLAIAGSIWELGRAALVLVNKWDLLDEAGRKRLDDSWPRLETLLASPRRLNVSAESGRGLEKLFPMAAEALTDFHHELSTGDVNRLFEGAVARHNPPILSGKQWKLFYATQVGTGPPAFLLFANRRLPRGHSYRRYLTNSVRREVGGLPGIPIRLTVRRR
ncbi:MAG: ribosome biogenesis GTPase Der [Thermoanaerobaculia bacterium]